MADSMIVQAGHAGANGLGEESLMRMKDESIICLGDSCFIMGFSF